MHTNTLAALSMGGFGSPPPFPIDRGWSWLQEAVCRGHGANYIVKSLIFGLSFVWGSNYTDAYHIQPDLAQNELSKFNLLMMRTLYARKKFSKKGINTLEKSIYQSQET